MTKYELMLIINPNISEEERNNSLDNLRKILKEFSGEIEKEDVWGAKKLAYKINSSTIGFYVLFNIEIDGKFVLNLTKHINLDLNIWRHMFVRKGI